MNRKAKLRMTRKTRHVKKRIEYVIFDRAVDRRTEENEILSNTQRLNNRALIRSVT